MTHATNRSSKSPDRRPAWLMLSATVVIVTADLAFASLFEPSVRSPAPALADSSNGCLPIIGVVILMWILASAFSKTTKCGACGASISKRARACPRCGDPR